MALGLTSFATRPLLAVIKLKDRRLLPFPHILRDVYYQAPFSQFFKIYKFAHHLQDMYVQYILFKVS